MVHATVGRGGTFHLICAHVGLVIKRPQERRPDVAPEGRVGNEYKKRSSIFFKNFFFNTF